MELPINNHILITPVATGFDVSREEAIKLLEPVISRITRLPGSAPTFIVGFALRPPDATTDPDWSIQVAEMEPAVRIEPYFKPKQSLYKGL